MVNTKLTFIYSITKTAFRCFKRIRLENKILTRKVFYLDFYRFTATYFSVGALYINYFKATLEPVAENVKDVGRPNSGAV